MKIRRGGNDRSGGRREKYVTLVLAAGTTHVGHGKTVEPFLEMLEQGTGSPQAPLQEVPR